MFKDMRKVPDKKAILDKAFSKSRKNANAVSAKYKNVEKKIKELKKMETTHDVIVSTLDRIIEECPYVTQTTPFYKALISSLIDVGEYKKSAASLTWARNASNEMFRQYKGRAKTRLTRDLPALRKEYYGRAASILKQIDKNLKYLEECRVVLKGMPSIKDMYTVVIAGLPNVGKSSMLSAITGAKPEIQPYPFTTKKILVGYIEGVVQVIDTPGLLDRAPKDRNRIERTAILALKHLANETFYVFDVSPESYDLPTQEALLKKLTKEFGKPSRIIANKADYPDEEKLATLKKKYKDLILVSAKTGEGIEPIKRDLFRKTFPGKERFSKA